MIGVFFRQAKMAVLLVCAGFHQSQGFASDVTVIPYLVSLQPQEFQAAWKDIDRLVAENATLHQPLADPLIARAELWARIGCHEDAVHDYNEAVGILLSKDAGLVERSRVLQLLHRSIRDLSSQPRPLYPQQAGISYRKGLELFLSGQNREAAFYLDDASRLEPSDVVYRVVRAINYRRLNRNEDSIVQLKSAAAILRDPYTGERHLRRFRQRLELIQGPDRVWAEESLATLRVSPLE
jgi:tetratricopeptide (TPR) repeat protein